MKIIKQDLWIFVYPNKDWYLSWCKNEMRHREDGPAEIWSYGTVHHLNGKNYYIDDYWKEIHENY